MRPTWRVLPINERYEVSSNGNVRNRRTKRLLHPGVDASGYPYVGLFLGDRVFKRSRVHGLILQAFHGACPVGCCANHIDGNKANNRLDNLEYVTWSRNTGHAYTHGLIKRALYRHKTKPLIPAILAYRANGVSINRTAQLVGVSRGTVRRVSTESPLGLTVSVSSNS